MRVLTMFMRSLFIICLPVLLITAVIAGAVNCSWLYSYGFEKYDVRQSLADNGLNLTSADMKEIARGFIHYFNSSDEYINLTVKQGSRTVPLFNQEETIHFKDVKQLFRLDYYVALCAFVYCLAFALISILITSPLNKRRDEGIHNGEIPLQSLPYQVRDRLFSKGGERLARDTIIGGGIMLGLMLLLGVGALLYFDDLLLRFHLIAFSNEFWSAEGNMLLLFPGGFWYDVAIYCVIAICVLAVFLIGVSWACLSFIKKKEWR